jgi:hypothetical protein
MVCLNQDVLKDGLEVKVYSQVSCKAIYNQL